MSTFTPITKFMNFVEEIKNNVDDIANVKESDADKMLKKIFNEIKGIDGDPSSVSEEEFQQGVKRVKEQLAAISGKEKPSIEATNSEPIQYQARMYSEVFTVYKKDGKFYADKECTVYVGDNLSQAQNKELFKYNLDKAKKKLEDPKTDHYDKQRCISFIIDDILQYGEGTIFQAIGWNLPSDILNRDTNPLEVINNSSLDESEKEKFKDVYKRTGLEGYVNQYWDEVAAAFKDDGEEWNDFRKKE